jgi:parallel beta-helix repeat protein
MSDTPTGATPNKVIRPYAQNITIKGITIQGNNSAVRQIGILSEGVRDNSGFTIESCEIRKVEYGIFQSGGENATPNENIRILNNKIFDFSGGIYWTWTTLGLDVIGNTIIGDGSEYDKDKKSKLNAIWIGLGTTNLHVCNNNVGSVQRMGMEIFWPYWLKPDTGGGADFSNVSKYKADAGVVITGNTVYDCGSMGISCGGNRNGIVANNSISNVRWVGLELVGDEREPILPNRYTNMVVIGNHIYNVNGQPRGLNKAYKPTHSTSSQSIQTHFSSTSSVNLSTVGATATFFLPLVGTSYPTLQVGKQFIARDTAALSTNTLTGKVLTYNQTTGEVVVTVLSKTGIATISNWTIFVVRTLVLTLDTLVPMAWGTNAASATSGWIINADGTLNTSEGGEVLGTTTLNLINTSTGGNVNQIQGFVTAYNPAVPNVVTMEITTATGSSTTPINTWRAVNVATIVAVSIDIIDGMIFANNYINTTVDAVSPKETTDFVPARTEVNVPTIEINFGCQVYLSKNIYISNNVFTRAGYRYLQVLESRDVVVENNKFISPTSYITDTGTTLTKTPSGPNAGSIIYDPTNPATELGDMGTPTSNLPNAAVYLFNATNCLLKGNYIKNSSVSNLWYASNGVSLTVDAFTRPEPRFGTDLRYRGNISEELTNITLPINCPVVDHTQQWNAATENFTGYRFHADPNNSRADSKILAVSAGAAKNIYNWNFASPTSNAIAAATTSLTFTVTSAQNIVESFFISWFTAAGGATATALPIGTFVRGEVYTPYAPTQFFEGRVTAFTPGAGTSGNVNFVFTCSVNYNTIPDGTYALWKLHFDQDAFNVATTGDLVLRKNIQADRTTGTKIGTSTSDKLSFWNAPVIVQPANITHATNATDVITRVNLVIDRLRSLGLISSV